MVEHNTLKTLATLLDPPPEREGRNHGGGGAFRSATWLVVKIGDEMIRVLVEEVGVADSRLDALLEEERLRTRAASLPAGPEIRRLTLGEPRTTSGGVPSDRGQTGQPVMIQQQAGVEGMLNDPRAQALGLGQLQEALRQSFGVLQQALGQRAPEHGLLGPLAPQQLDELHHSKTDSPNPHAVPAFYRDPTPSAPPPDLPQDDHLAFLGFHVLEHCDLGLGDFLNEELRDHNLLQYLDLVCQKASDPLCHLELHSLGFHDRFLGATGQRGGAATASVEVDIEKVHYMAREIMEVEDRLVCRLEVLVVDQQRGPDPPPGLNNVKISFDGAGGQQISESLRHLELPALPVVGSEGAALQFGDWMTMAHPLMSDLGMTAKLWWEKTVAVAEDFYNRWLDSSPLERLRLKPLVDVDPVFNRLEQRGISMLLAILPEGLRRDVVVSRNVSTVWILYRLYVVFQPGGGAERSALLKSLTEVKVLSKLSESVGKLGGAQVAYRLASVRQELQVDQRPNLPAVQKYAEFLQAEAEDLSLMMNGSKTASVATSLQSATVGATATPAVKAVALAGGGVEEKMKAPCKFWGTASGCRRGDSCTYLHSWEGIAKEGRCYGCSGEGHMKKDCPHRQRDGGLQQTPKVSKVKGASKEKESPVKSKDKTGGGKSEESVQNGSPSKGIHASDRGSQR
eukprot:s2541_g19.t1